MNIRYPIRLFLSAALAWGAGFGIRPATAQATLPFFEGFESGELADCWTATFTATNGRIAVTTNRTPYDGSYHVLLDSSVMNGDFNLNELVLEVDLTGQQDVTFDCQAKAFMGGQDIPEQFIGSTNRNGIALSVDGIHWHRLVPLSNMPYAAYTNLTVGLDGFAADRELDLDGVVWIKFQQYGQNSAGINGLAFDNVQLYAQSSQADLVLFLDGVPALFAVGDHLTYSVMVSNAGPDMAESVVLTNCWSLPSTVVWAEASRGTWTTNEFSVVAELGDLPAGKKATLEVTLQPLEPGILTNRAEAVASTMDIQRANNHQTATTVVEQAGGDLSIGPVLARVDEDRGWVDLTVFRTGVLAGTVSIDYETVDGTAEAGSDYEGVSGTLYLGNGVAEATLRIPILNDDLAEELEFFEVRLSQPGGGGVLVAPSHATVEIRDEDGIAVLPFTDGFEAGILSNCWSTYTSLAGPPFISGTNGPRGGQYHVDMGGESYSNVLTELVLSVDLEGRRDVDLRFWHKRWHFEGERPMPAVFADHFPADGVAISVDGTNWFKVHGLEDAETGEEEYRQFTVELDPILASHGLEFTPHVRIKFQKYGFYVPGQYGRFFDDISVAPRAGSLRFAKPWIWEVSENGGAITLAVERIEGDAGEVRVDYATYDGTAEAGSDYVATAGTLVFSDGVRRREIVVPILQDTLEEDPREGFTVLLFHPQGGASLSSPMLAEVAVIDDDGFGELEFSASQYTVMETADKAEIPVLRRYGSVGAGTVRWRTQAGTATPGEDYVETTGTLIFATGVVQQICEIPLLDDADMEGPETIQVILYEPEGDLLLGSVTTAWLTIQDDEAPRAAFPFYEGFEFGAWSNYWTVASTGAGRIQLANPTNGFEGNRSLVMDSAAGPALNEATLTVDLSGQTSVILRCWTRDFSDTAHPMPATFTGSVLADGIAVSTDGLNWHRLVDLAALGRQAVYTNLVVDLAAFAAERGLPLTALFQVRFQQYDTGAFPARGRAFDHISLTPVPAGPASVLRAQGFEGGTDDTWGFRLMPMAGQIAVRPERAASGSRALRLAGSPGQSSGPFVEFENVSFGPLESVFLSVAFSASGPDNDDNLFLHVSYDNGLTWTNAAKLVDGFGNAEVPFGGTSASNPVTVASNPWTMPVPADASQIKLRLVYKEALHANNTNDFYFIDDVILRHLPSNQPPVLLTMEDVAVPVGQRVEFAVTATDIDDDTITLSVSNLPSGAEFGSTNGTGLFIWESAVPTGLYAVTFHATDKDGTDEQTVGITVFEPEAELLAPVIQAATEVGVEQFTANWLASAGATGYLLDVAVNDVFLGGEQGSNLMVNAGFETGTSSGWTTFGSEYAVVTNDPYEGAYHVACTATGTRAMMQPVVIVGDGVTAYEVSFFYRKPAEGGNARIWSTWAAGGQVSGDSLQSATYLPVASNWTRVAYLVVPAPGTNTLNFEVRTYTGASISLDHFFVGMAGGHSSHVPGYENRDVGAVTSCVVTGLTANTTYFYRARAYNTVSNSLYSDTTNVTTFALTDIPPVLDAIGDREIEVGGSLQFQVAATPTDGDVVTLTASNLPPGATFDATNELGTFEWIGASPPGVYSVTFYATDKDGSDVETIAITVRESELLAPVIQPASGIQAEQFNANWLASAHATGYRLDVGTNDTFSGGGSGGGQFLLASNAATSPGVLTNGWGGFALGGTLYIQMTNSASVITSAVFSTVGYTNLTVDFRARTYGGGTKSNITISISTNDGVDWTVMGIVAPTNNIMNPMPTLANTLNPGHEQTRIRWQSLDAGAGIGVGVSSLVIKGWMSDGSSPAFVPGYENLDVGDVTTAVVTGLTEGVTYYYRALAYNATSNSPYSAVTNVVTAFGGSTPVPEPIVGWQSPTNGAAMSMQIQTASGVTYILQYTTDLSGNPPVWVQVDTEFGTGGAVNLQDMDSEGIQRFYRIVKP